MCDIGFFRINRLTINLIIVLFVSHCTIDKWVDCRAKLSLTVKNQSNNEIYLTVEDISKTMYGFNVDLTIPIDCVKLAAHKDTLVQIFYRWQNLNQCFFSNTWDSAYASNLKICFTDTLFKCFTVYPYDTLVETQDICNGCEREYSDTLIIK